MKYANFIITIIYVILAILLFTDKIDATINTTCGWVLIGIATTMVMARIDET